MRLELRVITARRLAAFAMMVLCVTGPSASRADPSVPWMPSAAARHDLEALVDDAGLDLIVTHWPLPRSAVVRALDALPAALSPALDAARVRVRRDLEMQAGSRLSLTVRAEAEALTGFGDDATRGSSIAIRSTAFGSEFVAAQVGGRIDMQGSSEHGLKARLDDSAVATETFGVQFQAWAHRSWWGPGWQSSLILGNNAPALNGFGLQRASGSRSESPWLKWLGPWNYEMFLAQTEDVSSPANPYLFGQRLTLRPWPDLEIGLTRTAQWGGRGRPQSLKSFLRMLTGRGVNANSQAQQTDDVANEMAGYDIRLRCPGGAPCAGYVQLIGEDQAGLLPSAYLGLYGVEWWPADLRQRYFVEYAETGCDSPIGKPIRSPCAYRNYAYPQGYTNAGRWMGAGVGPDSRLLTIGWLDADSGTSLRLSYGNVGSRVGDFTPDVVDPATSGRMIGVSARTGFQWGSVAVTPTLDYLQIAAAAGRHTQARLGLNLQASLDDAFQASGSALGASLSSADPSPLRPALVAVGLIAGSALLDRPLDNYVKEHGNNPSARAAGHIATALPIAGMALAGLSWVSQRGSIQGDVGWAAAAAGVSALAASELTKLAVDRARPSEGLGPARFGAGPRSESSFPSNHSAVAWAVATPYAKYYDAPWLYGLAALSSAGRLLSRDHWLSDTVAGAALGYFAGDLLYRSSGAQGERSGTSLSVTPRSVALQVRFE